MDKKYEEAYKKIENTLCLNSGNIKFNIDEDQDDCISIDEMAQCLDTLESSLSHIKMLEQQDLLHTKLWEGLLKAVKIIKKKPFEYACMLEGKPKTYEEYEIQSSSSSIYESFTEKEFNTLKSHKLI